MRADQTCLSSDFNAVDSMRDDEGLAGYDVVGLTIGFDLGLALDEADQAVRMVRRVDLDFLLDLPVVDGEVGIGPKLRDLSACLGFCVGLGQGILTRKMCHIGRLVQVELPLLPILIFAVIIINPVGSVGALLGL